MTEPIINAQGQTAIVYRQPAPIVASMITGKRYHFDVKSAVSLAWIDESDVKDLLNRKKKCCPGASGKIFNYANEAQVKLWNGEGR